MAIQNKSLISKGLSLGIPLFFGKQAFDRSREEGHGVAMSAARGIGDYVVPRSIGYGNYMALQAASSVPKLAVNAMQSLDEKSRVMNRSQKNSPFNNATFVDTQQNYTMRQAGMQMAKASQYNLQQSLMGNEAKYMHL